MKIIKLTFLSVALMLVISSCSKDKDDNNDNDGQFAKYQEYDCPANPQFCEVNSTIIDADDFYAEITTVNGVEVLHIFVDEVDIKVDYNGVETYNASNSNLDVRYCYNDGALNPCYRIHSNKPYTGGNLELLNNENGYMEGNFRYIIAYIDPLSNSTSYIGRDYGSFKIKLR
ncbi:MAG: hypothetical protein H6578_05715 [Chitinophagales bacterium]|nr:hypothetical protein [Chitinophagales bacterium]